MNASFFVSNIISTKVKTKFDIVVDIIRLKVYNIICKVITHTILKRTVD